MNKIKYSGMILVIIITLASCSKQNTEQLTNSSHFQYDINSKINYSKIIKKSKGFSGKKGSSNILVFSNFEVFEHTINELEKQVDELDSAFINFYKNLDIDDLNQVEEENGFNENQPIFDFGIYFNFNSLYNKIAIEELEWLNDTILDLENDPDNHFVNAHGLRAVLNTDCEVQIGKSIY